MFLFHHFRKHERLVKREVKWYRFINEQQYFGKLLEERIIKYTEKLIEQLQFYINPLDYTLRERIIEFLDNPQTKRSRSKTIRIAIMRCIRRRLRIVLKPLQSIFNFYQDDNIFQKLVNNEYEYGYIFDFNHIHGGYWTFFQKFEHYRFNWKQCPAKLSRNPHNPRNFELNEILESGCHLWSVGLQGIALEVLEPLSKSIGLDILQNIKEGKETVSTEKAKKQKELKLQQIKMIVEKYHLLQIRKTEKKISLPVETTNSFTGRKNMY